MTERKSREGSGSDNSDATPGVAPVVMIHYVGGSHVREMTPADLRRIDPEFQGNKHISWSSDNRFAVNASEEQFTDRIVDYLTNEGEFVATHNGEEPQVVSDMVARVEAKSRPLVRP